ncbi:response regulator [Azospirillum rugosum]|uniref:histidine kinase n=1 Tax=Azospirillum rugosum TaxID=416170 RepID=A0ABS4SIQ7_9PROT|nr:response regulator [Azospirillum rugosum]MBP2291295.1 signal transduction histidine kinase [Azospirillum rugosum]MDQ0525083.1 signal transduction histidine kinase [Azospirillum rugosum]
MPSNLGNGAMNRPITATGAATGSATGAARAAADAMRIVADSLPPLEVRILVVDDDGRNLLAMRETLSELGATVVLAKSGEEALKRVLDQDFAAILMDVHMPGMDGYETAELIRNRQKSRHIPILFLTAINKDEMHIFRGYSAGAVDYMFKPVDPVILRSKVSVFVELYRKTEEVKRQAAVRERLLAENFRVRTEKMEAEQALRRSEERQALIARSLPILLYTAGIGRGTPFRYVTENTSELFGFPAERFLKEGGFWESRLHPDDRERALAQFATALETGVATVEYRWRGADDKYRILLDQAVVLRDESGAPQELCGTILDVTDTREMQQQLAHVQKMETIGQLTGGIAHDFNNMLTVVIGSLERLARMVPDDPKAARRVDMALQAALRCSDLTRRLLAFARRQQLHPESVDMDALVRNMGELMERTLGPNIQVVIETAPPQCPALVDRTQAESALLNLVINARDAMAGNGRLSIATTTVTVGEDGNDAGLDLHPGHYVRLTVSDTGCGMPPDVLERAFEPFFTTKDVGKGTGLGLSMIHGFVKQSGGVIKVESAPDCGTTFHLYLPCAPDADPQSSRDPDAAEADAAPMPGHGEMVLVVDDDHDVRHVAVLTLQELGYNVLEAENGPTALTVLAGNPRVDLLFTDIVMPGGMNGLELANEAQRRYPDLKVLYASGYAHGVAGGVGTAGPGAEILIKPYRDRDLARAVRVALGATPACAEAK